MRTLFSDAVEMAHQPRNEAERSSYFLSQSLFQVQRRVEVPLVEGEAGAANVGRALMQLVQGRSKRDRGPGDELRAWMLAGVIAAGVSAAYEVTEGEQIAPESECQLQFALTDFALRPKGQPSAHIHRLPDNIFSQDVAAPQLV